MHIDSFCLSFRISIYLTINSFLISAFSTLWFYYFVYFNEYKTITVKKRVPRWKECLRQRKSYYFARIEWSLLKLVFIIE